MNTPQIELFKPTTGDWVRRQVLENTLAALVKAADDAMSYGPSEADDEYIQAINEAKAELEPKLKQ